MIHFSLFVPTLQVIYWQLSLTDRALFLNGDKCVWLAQCHTYLWCSWIKDDGLFKLNCYLQWNRAEWLILYCLFSAFSIFIDYIENNALSLKMSFMLIKNAFVYVELFFMCVHNSQTNSYIVQVAIDSQDKICVLPSGSKSLCISSSWHKT